LENSLIEPQFFAARDGQQLAWRATGEGRPVVLIHGFFSDAFTNWIRYGHAAVIAARGFRVIMPDLRAHGSSAKPHDASAYPRDVLADDGEDLIAHLGLTDYDLGGYSLGGRTTARLLARGARPRRAVIGGMGLSGLTQTAHRGEHFRHILNHLGEHERGSPEWFAEAFLKTNHGDPVALLHILDTFVDTPESMLQSLDLAVLAVSGADDHDNGSAQALADLVPYGQYREVPGNHMSAVLKHQLGETIADFLAS
jgi:pimeloyl-ACP methyl ester carboxylesterase